MIPTERSSGLLLHLSSLPGPHGIGDLGDDAHRFVDWLAAAGQRLWQLLPVNPIGPGHSPYMSVSAMAGSPLMVALQPLVQRGWLAEPLLPEAAFAATRVDFDHVIPWRMAQLRAAAAGFFERAPAGEREDFAAWCRVEAAWLDDYALFMALQTAHQGQPWWTWAAPLRDRERVALQAARQGHADEIAFWRFVQWCFDTQLAALKAHARARGVALVGDLPIFIAHDSADCWTRPDLYHLDPAGMLVVVAGVPPDELGPEGQRWGNPLYRWDRMAAEDYAWWTARARRALAQADIFRIDHFLGFCAYWEIPVASPGAKLGRWAAGPGQALFDAIQRQLGRLPIIAEDLGLITPAVRALRDRCGFPGMKVLQFAFGGDAGGDGSHEFLPHNYAPQVVVYSGTHDNDTAQGWWERAPPLQRERAASYLGCDARDGHDLHWAMIRGACNSPALMAVFPMQDVLGLGNDQRMNSPGTLGGDNWCWRFRWDQVDAETTRRLGLITAGSGRAGAGFRAGTWAS